MSLDQQPARETAGDGSQLPIATWCEANRLEVAGELDMRTAPELVRAALACRGADDLRIDLAAVRFIDASGISGLVRIHNVLRTLHRGLHLTGTRPRIARVFLLADAGWLLTRRRPELQALDDLADAVIHAAFEGTTG